MTLYHREKVARLHGRLGIDFWLQPIFLSAQIICPFMQKQGNGIFINLTRFVPNRLGEEQGTDKGIVLDVRVLDPDSLSITRPKLLSMYVYP